MPHTYTNQLVHYVFSTKDRLPLIRPEWQARLHAYLGGIARDNQCKAIIAGGVADHIHLLLSLHPTLSTARAMQLIKGGSSAWVNDEFPGPHRFAWQEGYGAFSIGISQIEATVAYIAGQEEHHRKVTFQDEFRAFLKRHGIDWDERYIWG